MATKEITKRETRYVEPDLERDLVLEPEDASVRRGSAIARLALLWQQRRFLFRFAAIAFGLSVLFVLTIPVRYTSTTRLMPPDQGGQGIASILAALGKTGDLGAVGSTLLGLKTSGDLFIGVLHSRTVQDDIVKKFDLRKVYGSTRYEDARKELENQTDVIADRKSGIITIKVTDSNRDRAAAIGREYVEALNNIVITLNTSSAHKERVFLEERLGQVQQDLETAEKDFGDFASKNTAIDVKEQGKAMIGAAAEIEGQLIAAETQLEGLRQIYTPNNVRVRSLQARIDEFRRQLKNLGGKDESLGGGKDEPSDSTAAPATEDLYPSIRKLPILGIEYADLFRRAKVEEAVFEALTKQYELAKVEEARETPSVKVLDPADVPERKSYPPRTLFTLLSTFVLVASGMLWILVHEYWKGIDPQDPAKALVQDVLGTITSKMPWRSGTGIQATSIRETIFGRFRRSDPEN
jgi:capsule polysaccharide export protein KpsE/RkpR